MWPFGKRKDSSSPDKSSPLPPEPPTYSDPMGKVSRSVNRSLIDSFMSESSYRASCDNSALNQISCSAVDDGLREERPQSPTPTRRKRARRRKLGVFFPLGIAVLALVLAITTSWRIPNIFMPFDPNETGRSSYSPTATPLPPTPIAPTSLPTPGGPITPPPSSQSELTLVDSWSHSAGWDERMYQVPGSANAVMGMWVTMSCNASESIEFRIASGTGRVEFNVAQDLGSRDSDVVLNFTLSANGNVVDTKQVAFTESAQLVSDLNGVSNIVLEVSQEQCDRSATAVVTATIGP